MTAGNVQERSFTTRFPHFVNFCKQSFIAAIFFFSTHVKILYQDLSRFTLNRHSSAGILGMLNIEFLCRECVMFNSTSTSKFTFSNASENSDRFSIKE